MSNFAKSQLHVDGNHIQMSVPFGKVDKENRLVSGFATLNNVDTQGDVVRKEASAKAFKRARGNIREMHQPIAAGKIVSFEEKDYFDKDSGEMFTGIYVTAYVSKGAPDTWEKVLDETLTGFSIGGEINDATNEFDKSIGKTIRYINDYDLTELSLVDNPANQLANVFSIQKSAQGSFMKGMMATTFIENVFVCKNDETVIVRDSSVEECPACGVTMENAGWFESGENRVDKVSSIVSDFWNPAETEAAPEFEKSEGGVEMGKKDEEVTETPETKPEEVEEEAPAADAEEVAPEAEEVEAADVVETDAPVEAEEAGTVVEVEDEEDAIAKRIDELHVAVKESLDKTQTETSARVSELEDKIEKATQDFLAKASEIETAMNSLGESITTQKQRIAAMESSIEKMNSSDAIKKSADVETQSVEKNVQSGTTWNGAFSGRRSSFSVDDLS